MKIFHSLICRQVRKSMAATEAMAAVDKSTIASGEECDNFIMIWRNFFHFFSPPHVHQRPTSNNAKCVCDLLHPPLNG